MVTVVDHSTRSSVHVAPLHIHKSHPLDSNNGSSHTTLQIPDQGTYEGQITPPATPNGTEEQSNHEDDEPTQPVFHSFLRAVYPFQSTEAVSDSTVTLSLNEGDIVLVHSVHINGWADGTLLPSGARGWLPTNYCESYEPEYMRSLLKALLHFWDLLRSGVSTESEVFGNQEFMRGIIAGVRYLLEKSNCLTRESLMVQSSDSLRRNRKALLSDLSSLVKTAKRLQEFHVNAASAGVEDENELIDEMILKAFKIVTRGVKFLDVLEEDRRARTLVSRPMATVAEEASAVPPTPPADSISFENTASISDAGSRRTSMHSSASGVSGEHSHEGQTRRHSYKRMSINHANSTKSSKPTRSSVSHRLSTAGHDHGSQRDNRISEQLSKSHDTLLSYLGSLIGRLQLQSQSPGDLLPTIRHSIASGRALLTIVEAVCAHDVQSGHALLQARDTMYHCINQLILAARESVRAVSPDDEDMMMPQENPQLKDAATDCVIAAGECVAKTKFVIEKIGDFEIIGGSQGLGIDLSSIGRPTTIETKESVASDPEVPSEPSTRPPRPPLQIPPNDRPIPHVPTDDRSPVDPSSSSDTHSDLSSVDTSAKGTRSSKISLLPPLPKLTSSLLSQEEYSPSDQSLAHDGDFQSSFRSDSIAVSTARTSSTYMSGLRNSESSIISRASTRATTPDTTHVMPAHQTSFSEISLSDSQTTLAEEADDTESKLLEKTFAHELLFNKEGQITGGTLPALVERLTMHDSTPDAMFVSTFYLTFRLFVQPLNLAEALVDRFDYVSESPHIATPVRLRVYNVFKGWIESHWRELSDHEALPVIEAFAQTKLTPVLPAAGRRLLELAHKVSSNEGPLVPRLVSSMGKTSTSIAQYISPDTPLPAPVMNKNQVNALKNWKMGGSSPTILDFDPLELARQLTIKEMNIFCSIMPEELLASEWMKKSGSNAVNVRAMSTLSTDLSNLVADTILQYDDAKKRAVVIKHWIKIADKCLELNNYDSLMAIICSLNSSTITRLKKTWDIVSQKRKDMLDVLQDIIEPTKNHAVLRQRLHDHVPPCLPFVGTYLTDLTFVDIGNPATKQLPGIGSEGGVSVINFDKHTRTAKIIGELQRFQIPYRLTEVPELQEWIQAQIVRVRSSVDQNNVQQYYRRSLLLEPRVNLQKPSPVDAKEKFDLFAWTHFKE